MVTDRFIENIDKQIEFNQSKNILLDSLEIFQFANETVIAISNIDKLNADSRQFLIDYATDKAIEEFCRVNQYYSFDSKATKELEKIYSDLFENFQTKSDSIENLMQPVLDIGCGSCGNLVNFIKNQGIRIYGIDRFKFTTSNRITA